MDDSALLRQFVTGDSEEAFSRIVSQHLNLVYSAALRQVRDPHLAQDVTQSVFVLLARKARGLPNSVLLSGWLYRAAGFVAADALRAENRRRQRETAAMEPLYESKRDSVWAEIEPILDGAMAELSEKDRNLVLLRFFEEKSLKDVGAALGISEDAAQKKVARALEKLRGILEARGARISAGGLGAALVAFGCASAPPATAGAIAAITSASTAAIGLSVFTKTALELMATTKLKLTAAGLVLASMVTVPYLAQQRTISQVQAENETLRAAVRELQQRPEPQAAAASDGELTQLRNDAAEVPKLRGQIAALLRERQNTVSPAALKRAAAPGANGDDGNDPELKNPMSRQGLADRLMREGKFPEALQHYLWCFDEGTKNSPSYAGVRNSFLLMQLKNLADKYPPAKEALAARRDALETSLQGGGEDPMAAFTLVQMNKNLGEPDRTLSFFDQLPQKSPAREKLVSFALDQFTSANRFQDIVDSGRPEAAFDQAVGVMKMAAIHDETYGDQATGMGPTLRRSAVEAGGHGLEALAAVGQTERANALIDKILKFDASPETKSELMKYAQRAGNAGVIAHLNQ